MATVYGGDEVNAVVIDIGSYACKAGYAGDDTPKAVYPSHVGVVSTPNPESNSTEAEGEQLSRKLYVGASNMTYRRDNMEVISPFGPDDLLSDWETVESLLGHAFTERLHVEAAQHAVLLAEPSHVTRPCREKAVEVMFETFQVPALFLAKASVLSSFAMARQTSLVVDMGYRACTVAAVHDGYVLNKSIVRSPIAGQIMTQCMAQSIEGRGAKLRPRYTFKRVERIPGVFDVIDREVENTTASFHQYSVEAIAADIKESVCRTSDNMFVEEDNTIIPTVTYELPDGQEIQVGPDRFKIPEVCFQPALLKTYVGMDKLRGMDGGDLLALPDLVMDSINRCDVDVRRELYSGIVLTGGSSLFPGLRDRLERALSEAAPSAAKVKITAPANNMERRFSVWIGGSILASLGSFQQMWMSKKEYEEHGSSLIHRRSP